MKKTCSVKGVMLLVVRIKVVVPIFAHVKGALLTWVTLFFNVRGALPTQNKEKLQGDNFFLHLSRENFEGLEQTREYLSHNMMVTIFRFNRKQYLMAWEDRNG